jgi:hypothetical protein
MDRFHSRPHLFNKYIEKKIEPIPLPVPEPVKPIPEPVKPIPEPVQEPVQEPVKPEIKPPPVYRNIVPQKKSPQRTIPEPVQEPVKSEIKHPPVYRTIVPQKKTPQRTIMFPIDSSSYYCDVTIITPCSRPENIPKIMESINFDFIHEWIIVYDGKNIDSILEFDNPKIKEYIHTDEKSIKGTSQRNYGLDVLTDSSNGYVYFLDDDNYIHHSLYKLINNLEPGNIYTFNQENNKIGNLLGNTIRVNRIDTAMFLVPISFTKNIRWNNSGTHDGEFITEIYNKYPEKWIYVNEYMCYYNKI